MPRGEVGDRPGAPTPPPPPQRPPVRTATDVIPRVEAAAPAGPQHEHEHIPARPSARAPSYGGDIHNVPALGRAPGDPHGKTRVISWAAIHPHEGGCAAPRGPPPLRPRPVREPPTPAPVDTPDQHRAAAMTSDPTNRQQSKTQRRRNQRSLATHVARDESERFKAVSEERRAFDERGRQLADQLRTRLTGDATTPVDPQATGTPPTQNSTNFWRAHPHGGSVPDQRVPPHRRAP